MENEERSPVENEVSGLIETIIEMIFSTRSREDVLALHERYYQQPS